MIQGKQIMPILRKLLRLFGIKALRNTDSQLWLHMGCVLWVGEHVCDQVHVNNNNNNNNNNNKLKRTLSHYCACTKLRFSDRMLRIQKIHIVL